MCRAICLAVAYCLVCAASPTTGQEGRLQKVRDNIHAREDPSSPKKDDKDNTREGDEDNFLGDLFGELFGGGILIVAGSPFTVPCLALGDDYRRQLYFARFPYHATYPGYMMLNPFASPEVAEKWCQDGNPRDWSLRLSLENGNDFSGLNRLGGQMLVESIYRFGLLTSWHYFHEHLCRGRHDEMTIGDFNLTYRFAQNEWAMFRVGLGARAGIDLGHTAWGFNFHYGADFFPARPWVFGLSMDAGTLGSAGLIHGRATAGVV
jgi:hypothetical protein